MDKITFYAPEAHQIALRDLNRVPFAKSDDGYRFAYWVYDLNNTEELQAQLLASDHGEEAAALIAEAKAKLENIVISEDNYLDWSVHNKEAGGVAEYHKIIHDLSINLLMLSIDMSIDEIENERHASEEGFYTIVKSTNNDAVKRVLNRNNPFADVTIKSQQFFFKAGDGSTETLFFNTNNIIEKVDKNGKDMLTMRPSFSVTKEHGVMQKPMQKVTFANSVTEPIVGDEDHVYIHID